MTFEDLFPNLAYWADMGNQIQIGADANTASLVTCTDMGGTVYESPAEINDLQRALELAEAAIAEWVDENEDD
jgi:hypothetical protein